MLPQDLTGAILKPILLEDVMLPSINANELNSDIFMAFSIDITACKDHPVS